MLERTTYIKVLNRDNGAVVYTIPEMNGLVRTFQSGETKEVTFEELQKLSFKPGGDYLLRNCLVILDNEEAVKELLNQVEPEYFYTKQDIINLMKNGSLDEFLDCLDFAPDGVKDLIKTLAVELPLNDVAKRDAILDKLGFNVNSAIRIAKETAGPDEEKPQTGRRVAEPQVKKTSTPGRRVVKTQEN